MPGLHVIAPTTPYDAKGGLIASIRDDNPVIYVEHRILHFQQGYVPEEPYTIEMGRGRITHPGDDVTIVGISHMQLEAQRAAEYLREQSVEAEVIDPHLACPA